MTMPEIFVQQTERIDEGLQRRVQQRHWFILNIHPEHFTVRLANR